MANRLIFKETTVGVGDHVKVHQRLKEKDKERVAVFDGTLIAIKGSGSARTITVRRIGEQTIGIERIFPLDSPTIEKIEVVKSGLSGSRRAKLYFIRSKSKRETAKIYTRQLRRKSV